MQPNEESLMKDDNLFFDMILQYETKNNIWLIHASPKLNLNISIVHALKKREESKCRTKEDI